MRQKEVIGQSMRTTKSARPGSVVYVPMDKSEFRSIIFSEKKKNKIKKIVILIILMIFVIGCCIYAGISYYYSYHFFYGTTINGIDSSNKTAYEVEQEIAGKKDNYTIQVRARMQDPQAITGKDIDYKYISSGAVLQLLKTQKSWEWIGSLFETKNYFAKTGIDYIYSAFHIMNLHIEKKVCRNELLIFLYNDKAFILILDKSGIIVFHETIDLPTFEIVKKTHFYEDDLEGQKLFDEIYYLELNEIIHNTLNDFYNKKSGIFVEKITILYVLKQLTNEDVEQLAHDLMLKVDYNPINIDEEIFELSKDKHLKKSFIKPRKKKKKRDFKNLYITIFILVLSAILYQFYLISESEENFYEAKIEKVTSDNKTGLPDHVNLNDKIEQRIKNIFSTIPNDVILKELKITPDSLAMRALLLKDYSFSKEFKTSLDYLYKSTKSEILTPDKKENVDALIISKGAEEISNITYKNFEKEYITDELISIERVTEQLKILMPENAIIKFLSTNTEDITTFKYSINILVKEPREFFKLISILNNELYSINISYPISMLKTEVGIEIEFNLEFNQPK